MATTSSSSLVITITFIIKIKLDRQAMAIQEELVKPAELIMVQVPVPLVL